MSAVIPNLSLLIFCADGGGALSVFSLFASFACHAFLFLASFLHSFLYYIFLFLLSFSFMLSLFPIPFFFTFFPKEYYSHHLHPLKRGWGGVDLFLNRGNMGFFPSVAKRLSRYVPSCCLTPVFSFLFHSLVDN